jgi:hypothetical protein
MAQLTKQQAKLEWYKINPQNQTHINLEESDEINIILKMNAKSNFDGFVTGLQYAGVVIVE